jgi:hypothetical protein
MFNLVDQIRMTQNRIQVWKNVDDDKIWELENIVKTFNSQIESLKLELCHYIRELSCYGSLLQVRSSRYEVPNMFLTFSGATFTLAGFGSSLV